MRVLLALLLLTAIPLTAEDPYRQQWISVADHLTETAVEDYPFNWGEGVQMIGLLKVHGRTLDKRYLEYAEKWFAQFDAEKVANIIESGYEPGAQHGYCGHWSPATAALQLHRATRKSEYLVISELAASYIIEDAGRHPREGGLAHWLGNHQYWVDTLYMACPLMAGLARQYGEEVYLDDAARQLTAFAHHLQNKDTGLFAHMWDWDSDKRTAEPWGRGNGWVIMSLADTMEMMERDHRSWMELEEIAVLLADGLDATQDNDGLWHTILDDPESYPEASATTMAVYGLLKLVRLGVLRESYIPIARDAWMAVNKRYVADGVVTGVSAGTGPEGRESYKTRPTGTYTWGTGAYLMAGSEIDRLK